MLAKEKGFTLVELIMVIALVSILGAFAIGLFSSSSQFTPTTIRDAWINQLRFTQRQAFLKTHLTQPLLLTITQDSESWFFAISQNGETVDSYEIERSGYTLKYSNSSFSNACSALSNLSFPFVLRYNGYGDLVNNLQAPLNINQRFCIDSNPEKNWCVGPSGYAYGGQCVP